jgi:hypothetical protein
VKDQNPNNPKPKPNPLLSGRLMPSGISDTKPKPHQIKPKPKTLDQNHPTAVSSVAAVRKTSYTKYIDGFFLVCIGHRQPHGCPWLASDGEAHHTEPSVLENPGSSGPAGCSSDGAP